MRQHHQRRRSAAQPGQAHRAHALEHHSGAGVIQRVGHRTGEHPQRAQHHLLASPGHTDVVDKGNAQPQVAQAHGRQGAQAWPLTQGDGLEHQHQGRVGEQDQPLQPGADVLQAIEVEQAGQVVAQQPEQRDTQPIAQVERCATLTTAGPYQPGEHRQRQPHAQCQQADGVHRPCGIGELDEDGLEAETQGRQHGVQGAALQLALDQAA
ncbi:hypothetical protein D3C75_792750 [compost metagenome]